MIRVIIRLSEDSRYYQVRQIWRIFLPNLYLHPSTYYSVSTQTFHFSVTPSHICRYMNINMLSIGFSFRIHLRSRLTLIRLALIRKPWSFGVRVFHPHYRYLCLHLLFQTLQHVLRHIFDATGMLPYLLIIHQYHSFGNMFNARLLSTPDRSTSELLRTL
jgi:hypothetical protein